MSVSNARTELPGIVESLERTVITKNGEPVAILLHLDDFRALQATQALARHPEHLSQVLSAHARVQSGDLSHTKEIGTEIFELNPAEAVLESLRLRQLSDYESGLIAKKVDLTDLSSVKVARIITESEKSHLTVEDIAQKVRAIAEEAKIAAETQPDRIVAEVAAKVGAIAEEVNTMVRAG